MGKKQGYKSALLVTGPLSGVGRVGAGPRDGQGMASLTPAVRPVQGGRYDNPSHVGASAFFAPSNKSQAARLEQPNAALSSIKEDQPSRLIPPPGPRNNLEADAISFKHAGRRLPGSGS